MHHPPLQPLVISAPFGNYVQPKGTTPTLGTFTALPRPGRVWRVLRTVRYYPRIQAWVNRIGLRNPGIDWLVSRAADRRIDVRDKLVSIHGFDADQWYALLDKAAALEPLGIELNMSCPNVGELDWPEDLFTRAAALHMPGNLAQETSRGAVVVVKLPPVNYQLMVRRAMDAGLFTFHCCNTLPVVAGRGGPGGGGGLSGRPLKPVALQCVRALRALPGGDRLTLIGGGGVREPTDVDDYADAGADHIAVGTRTMNPLYLVTHRPLTPLIDRAAQRLGGPRTPAPRNP